MKYRIANLRIGSTTENEFVNNAINNGWEVHKKGWPDFIIKRGNDIRFVEVKRSTQEGLKKHQLVVCKLLTSLGLKVYLWKPATGFKKIS